MTLAAVFLGVIALTSLVQVAAVVALALGLRRLESKLAHVQARYDGTIAPALGRLDALTRRAADGVEAARVQFVHVDDAISRSTVALDRAVTAATGRAERAVDRAEAGVDSLVHRGISAVEPRSGRAGAVVRGVRTGLRVWRAFRPS